MREYGVRTCSEECGNTTLHGEHGWFVFGVGLVENEADWFCPVCGTRVGIDERGPWREAMVPRAALEYVAKCWARYDPGEVNPDEAIAYALKHAENAALKAAEEAMRDDV